MLFIALFLALLKSLEYQVFYISNKKPKPKTPIASKITTLGTEALKRKPKKTADGATFLTIKKKCPNCFDMLQFFLV